MNRGMNAEVQAEVAQAENEPVHLLVAELDSGTFRFTDGPHALVWDGETYTAGGDMLAFEAIRETASLQVTQCAVTISGVPQTSIAAFLQDDYLDRRLRIYKTFLRGDGTAMEPTLIFDGRMDAPVIEENAAANDGSCTIAIAATSHFGDFERKPGRRTNTNVQELFFPGDKFFDFNSQIPGQKQSAWGRV